MAISVQSSGYSLPINPKLLQILTQELEQSSIIPFNDIIINFRDHEYSPENGGFHPVEFLINKSGAIEYITDFSYFGLGDMAELDKEIDFVLSSGIFQHMGRVFPIEQGFELFEMWQQNFIAYYEMGAFDDISIESY